ncbi:MAG: flavin reductase family protein, partial [Pseudoflavonifractor sp.]
NEAYRPQLKLCGTESGRAVNKVKECGFTVAAAQCGAPYFEEAELVLVCRKLYHQALDPACFTDPLLDGKNYPSHDYHTMYIGEITEILKQD